MKPCRLVNRFELLSRRQYKRYQGPAIPATDTGWPFVVSEQVPFNFYWILWAASLVQMSNSGAGISSGGPSLYLLPNSVTPPKDPQADPFFLNYAAISPGNYGPPDFGLRIDDWMKANAETPWLNASPGAEIPMLISRPYFLLAQRESVMGYIQPVGNPANAGSQLELRLCFTQLKMTEDFDL